MATAAINDRSTPTPASAKLGWVLSGVAIIFLGTDAGAKLLVPTLMAAYTPPQLRIPSDRETFFGVYLGIALWAGLWLREPRLRAIIPLRG